jgi:hypothetical protein
MLAALQQRLSDIYQLGRAHDVRDYLITDPILAKVFGQDAMLHNSEETLLVSQDDDALSLSLYLDAEMLDRLESSKPLDSLRAGQLDDLWKVLEGISHFNCVVWKAMRDRTVTLLELELQGEIDKYVSTMLLALEQSDVELVNRLHGWLFDNVRYHDALDDEQLDRYRSANDYAARFCHRLHKQLINDDQIVLSQLRHFYRLQFADKISHIHSHT